MHYVRAHRTDTIPSLALYFGFFWKTLWNHPENAELKAARKNPNVLLSGDKVFIPDLQQKYESRPTDAQHRFRRKGDPAKISIKLMRRGKPRANVPYVLDIGEITCQGTTDGEGMIHEAVPGDVGSGILTLNNGKEKYKVRLGALDPVDSVSGVQQRLINLGYPLKETGDLDVATVRALSRFQSKYHLTVTGKIDDPTTAKLSEICQ